MPDARHRWIDRLLRYQASGQTVAAFCAKENVSVPSFYFWKRKLADSPTPLTPVPIQLTPTHQAAIELRFPSGLILRLPTDYTPQQLAILVTTLEARPC